MIFRDKISLFKLHLNKLKLPILSLVGRTGGLVKKVYFSKSFSASFEKKPIVAGVGFKLASGDVIDYNEINGAPVSVEEVAAISFMVGDQTRLLPLINYNKAYFCGENVKCPSAEVSGGYNASLNNTDGELLTSQFRSTLKEQSWAVNQAYNTMIGDKHCHLVCTAEAKALIQHIDKINELRSMIGLSPLNKNNNFWTCNLAERSDNSDPNSSIEWVFYFTFGGVNDGARVQDYMYVLPIANNNN